MNQEVKVVIKIKSKNECVETVAKRTYWSMVNQYMKKIQEGFEDSTLEEKIDVLKVFLEKTDLGKLRSQIDDFLDTGKHVSLILTKNDNKVKSEIVLEEE